MPKKKVKESIRYAVPFEIVSENIKEGIENGPTHIKGIAVSAVTSRNGVTYEMEELIKAKETLTGKSIGLNHSDDVTDNVGLIESVEQSENGLTYTGKAFDTGKHPYISDMIKKGLITHVSLEAISPRFEERGGKKIAKDMEFLGLSFVRHPGIPDASVTIAEAFEKLKEDDDDDYLDDDDDDIEIEEDKIEGEIMTEEKIETKLDETLKKDVDSLKESIKSLEELKEIKERVAKLEEQPKSKGIVTAESAPVKTVEYFKTEKEARGRKGYVVEKTRDGMMLYSTRPEELY
jgi:hypothetical protein